MHIFSGDWEMGGCGGECKLSTLSNTPHSLVIFRHFSGQHGAVQMSVTQTAGRETSACVPREITVYLWALTMAPTSTLPDLSSTIRDL